MNKELREHADLRLRLEELVTKAKQVLEVRFDCEVVVRRDQTLDLKLKRQLPPQDAQLLGQVSTLLSNEILALSKRYLDLANQEKNIEMLVDGLRNHDSNVVSMDQFKRDRGDIPITTPLPTPKIYFAVTCFLEGSSTEDRRNLAFELHYASHRIAFVPYFDLEPRVRVDSAELLALGPVTLFIPEISELTPTDQMALLNYFRGSRTSQTPHVITSSKISYADLLRLGQIPVELLEHLATSLIRMTKPFDEYVQAGVVPHLYQSLLDRSLERSPRS